MPTHTFISDPSLLRKDSRSRSIVISAINSHTAKHKHAKRRCPDLQPRQHGHGLKRSCSCKLDRPCHIHLGSNVTDVPAGIKFRHSQYLQATYGGSEENLINTLFSYCINVAGPLYVWNYPNIGNRRTAHRDLLVKLFMTEPAFTEATLAWLHWIASPQPPGVYTVEMLRHQNKSYSFIASKLARQDRTVDPSLLSSIAAHLIMNQACGDWSSYETNLNGLNQIVVHMGGLETLKNTNRHAYDHVLGLQKMFVNHSTQVTLEARPLRRLIMLRSCSAVLVRPFSLPSTTLPVELMSLIARGEMRHDIATCLGEAIALLGELRSSASSNPTSASQKSSVESTLLDLLENRQLMFAEYTLAVGLLVKLTVTLPSGEIRGALRADPIASWLVSEFAELAMTEDVAKLKAPVLWTCLVIMEMPFNVGPNLGIRISLLRHIVLEVSGQSTWRENRKMLASIYLDTEFEILLSKCWEKILQPQSLSSLNGWTSPRKDE